MDIPLWRRWSSIRGLKCFKPDVSLSQCPLLTELPQSQSKRWSIHPQHRVYRVPGFLSNRSNWVHQPPCPLESVAPPLRAQGGRYTCLRGRGLVDPIPTMVQTLWYSRYTINSVWSTVSAMAKGDRSENVVLYLKPSAPMLLISSSAGRFKHI